MMARLRARAGGRLCVVCVWLGCFGLIATACGGSVNQSSGDLARARLVAQFRTRQQAQGFSPAIASCLARDAGGLPVRLLTTGTPPDAWYVHALTTRSCGPPAVRAFIIAALGREFSSRPQ